MASKELASLVNSPFEAFEAVEISDDLPTDIFMESSVDREEQETQDSFDEATDNLNEVLENQESLKEVVENNEEVPVISFSHVVEDKLAKIEQSESEDYIEGHEELNTISKDPEETGKNVEPMSVVDEEEEEEKNYRFAWGFLSGFAAAVVVIALGIGICVKFDLLPKGVAALLDRELRDDLAKADSSDTLNVGLKSEPANAPDSNNITLNDNNVILSGNINDNDSVDSVPTRPSDEPVYDTVSTTRYLTTMAKEHYGNFNLWPIIYEENQAILGHPDRIKPGTRVVIPPLSKYKVNPDNPDDIKRMKQKGNSIYARYK